MQVGDIVKVRSPFNETYTENYSITEISVTEDNQTVYVLGDLGAFSETYLEVV